MMKKNLFLLFSFYFFVLQSIFIGFLRGENNFFLLAAVNLVFILFIALISKEKKRDSNEDIDPKKVDKKIDDKKINDEKIEKTSNKKIKRTYKPIHHVWFFVISVLFGFFVWFWIGDIVLYLQLLVSASGSFVLFVLFGILFRFKSLKVWEGRIYMIVLILLLVWSGIKVFNINFSNLNNAVHINTGINNFVSVDDDVVNEADNNVIDQDIIEMYLVDPQTRATLDDVIMYLLNDVELNTNKNIKFNYIPYSSENYPYYRTAYDKKMIGKTINPEKELFCETYVVMKGLVEGRSVGSYGDIKLAYWNYAENNDLLPDCEYGKYLTIGDMK